MLSLLRLERKQKNIQAISNSHISLSFLLIWNWNDKYVHTLRSSLENHIRFQTKMGKVYTGFRPKRRKSSTRWGGTYLYGLYKGVPPLPVSYPWFEGPSTVVVLVFLQFLKLKNANSKRMHELPRNELGSHLKWKRFTEANQKKNRVL